MSESDDEQLRQLVSTVLRELFGGPSPPIVPISATDLLVKVISATPRILKNLASSAPTPAPAASPSTTTPPHPQQHPPPARRFRLTDLARFRTLLETLALGWEHGRLRVVRAAAPPDGEVCVLEVHVGPLDPSGGGGEYALLSPGASRKRKRVVDEDADSAAGADDEDEEDEEERARYERRNGTPLAGLSQELREVYALLQRGTARGRLLAEQYRSPTDAFEPICPRITKEDCVRFRRSALSANAGANISTSTGGTGPAPPPEPNVGPCSCVHFRPLIRPHTDPALGHCSYLNTCYSEPTYAHSPSIPPFSGGGGGGGGPSSSSGMVMPFGHGHGHGHGLGHGQNPRGAVSLPSGLGAGGRGKEKAPCRYLHFEVDWDPEDAAREAASSRSAARERADALGAARPPYKLGIGLGPDGRDMKVLPPQWINCDLRRFDYSVLGKFHVIMADPPWDIHMSLPYGTMTDDEMRAMPIPMLQDEGLLFLWVTGRAMEVGRECLRFWGYTRVDEVVWVKTNQLQRVIRTGRTGHWLNHTKEHMLVGVKTGAADPATGALAFPAWANRGLDTDVIVSEVRETSRKPDEVYGLIERMCPGGRKVEIFGRKHNTRPGWLTLGNQLGTDQIYEEDLASRIMARYPERKVVIPSDGTDVKG